MSDLKNVHLDLPARTEDLRKLEIGSVAYLTGRVFTAREGVYKRAIADGFGMPAGKDALGITNFHCSPAASINPDGTYTVGAVTATASFRFAQWLDGWFKISGCNIIIGKGGMTSQTYREHFVPNNAVYLTTVGYGTGALLGRGIKRVAGVYWLEELGLAQAVWVLDVEKFGPFLVESDLAGNSLFERENAKIAPRLRATLRRHQARHAAPLRRDRRQDEGSDLILILPREAGADRVSHHPNKRPLRARIDLDLGAVRDRFGDVDIEAGNHGEVGERRALDHDRIGAVQHQCRRHYAPRAHLMQHPGGGDAAFGGIEHQHAAAIALAGELVLRPREDAANAVEIVACGKAVARDQRLRLHFAAHARRLA